MKKAEETESREPIASFECYVPQLQSATTISSDGLARIKLELPPTELAETMRFIAYGSGKLLRVVVYPAQET